MQLFFFLSAFFTTRAYYLCSMKQIFHALFYILTLWKTNIIINHQKSSILTKIYLHENLHPYIVLFTQAYKYLVLSPQRNKQIGHNNESVQLPETPFHALNTICTCKVYVIQCISAMSSCEQFSTLLWVKYLWYWWVGKYMIFANGVFLIKGGRGGWKWRGWTGSWANVGKH